MLLKSGRFVELGSVSTDTLTRLSPSIIANAIKIPKGGPQSVCSCGNEGLSQPVLFIVCLLCGSLCHPECGFDVPETIMDQLDEPNWYNYNWLYYGKSDDLVNGTLCICEKCTKPEAYVSGDQCAVCLVDNELRSTATTRIHSLHNCSMCEKPVHAGCCVYVARRAKGEADACHLGDVWDATPTCVTCYGDAQEGTESYQRWKQPKIFIGSDMEFPFPISVSKLRQVVDLDNRNDQFVNLRMTKNNPWFTDGLFEVVSTFQTSTTDFNTLDTVGPIETNVIQMDNSEHRIPYKTKVSRADIDRLFSQFVECTPGLIELWIAVLARFVSTNKTLLAKASILPMGFTSELFDAVRESMNRIDESGDAMTRFYQSNRWWTESIVGKCHLVLPFMHEVIRDYGIIVIPPFETKDHAIKIVVIDYCENSLFCENRYNAFVKRGLEEFFRVRSTGLLPPLPKINFNRIIRANGVPRSTVNNDRPFTDGGFNLCYDLRNLVTNKRGPGYHLDEIRSGLNWNFPTDESKERFRKAIICLRTIFLIHFMHKFTQTMESWINTRFCGYSKAQLQVAKEAFKSLFFPLEEMLTIETIQEKDYVCFVTALRSCLVYEELLGELYVGDSLKIFYAENMPSIYDEKRMYLSMVSIDIPNPEFWGSWFKLIEMTPSSILVKSSQLVEKLFQFPLRVGDNHFNGLQQLREANTTVQKVVSGFEDDKIPGTNDKNPGMIKMCSLDLTSAIAILELFQVSNTAPPGTILLYSTNVVIEQRMNDKLEMPGDTNRIVCLVYDEKIHHYAVFEILLDERQVVVYDGEDGTPFLLRDEKRNRLHKPCKGSNEKEAADRAWSETARRLLHLLGVNQPITIASDVLTGTTINEASWRIAPVGLAREGDWESHLIRQFDGYSCGYIAILHIMKLMGRTIHTHFDQDVNKCVPQEPCQSLAEVLKNMELKEAVGKWFARYSGNPSAVTSDFYEFYGCGKHVKAGTSTSTKLADWEMSVASELNGQRNENVPELLETTAASIPTTVQPGGTPHMGERTVPIVGQASEGEVRVKEATGMSTIESIIQIPDSDGLDELGHQNPFEQEDTVESVAALVGEEQTAVNGELTDALIRLRHLRENNDVVIIPHTVTDLGFELDDAIMIMEKTTGCSELVESQVVLALENNGEISIQFSQTLDRFFLQGTELLVQDCLVDDSTAQSEGDSFFLHDFELRGQDNVAQSNNKKQAFLLPEIHEISGGERPLHETWQSIMSDSTFNGLCLFQATSLIRNQVDSEDYYASPTKSPPFNRSLETHRVYSRDRRVRPNPGIQGSILRQGSSIYRKSIYRSEVVAWPYLLCLHATGISAHLTIGAKTVLSHLPSRIKKREASCPFIKEVEVEDAIDLINLLDTDKIKSCAKKNSELASLRWPNNPECQFCFLFAIAVSLLESNFGSLRTIKDWRSLYHHLVPFCPNWTKASGIPRDRPLINLTIILFQTLCPIKLAFLDGQARLISIAHYIRQVVPGEPNSTACLEGIHSHISGKGVWSVQTTSTTAHFRIVVPSRECASYNDLTRLRERGNHLLADGDAISQSSVEELDIAEKSHFFNIVQSLINELNVDKTNPTDVEEVERYLKNLKSMALEKLFYGLPVDVANDLSPETRMFKDDRARIDHVSLMLADGAPLPKFGKRNTTVAGMRLSEHKILMCVCATLLANETSRFNVEELLALNWKIARDPGAIVNNLAINEFNVNTYISTDPEFTGIFEEHLYKPLLPIDIDNPASLQFMVTTFYAPIYMLTTICHRRVKGARDSIKKEISIFLNFSEDMTNLLMEFGMVLPVWKKLETCCRPVYELLIPEKDFAGEKLKYACTCWAKRSFGKEAFGWSNYPLMLWLIGYLIQEGIITVSLKYPTKNATKDVPQASYPGVSEQTYTANNLPGIEFYVHRLQTKYSLFGIVKCVLFELQEIEVLAKFITARSHQVTKDSFYTDLKSLFNLDGHGNNSLGGAIQVSKHHVITPIERRPTTSKVPTQVDSVPKPEHSGTKRKLKQVQNQEDKGTHKRRPNEPPGPNRHLGATTASKLVGAARKGTLRDVQKTKEQETGKKRTSVSMGDVSGPAARNTKMKQISAAVPNTISNKEKGADRSDSVSGAEKGTDSNQKPVQHNSRPSPLFQDTINNCGIGGEDDKLPFDEDDEVLLNSIMSKSGHTPEEPVLSPLDSKPHAKESVATKDLAVTATHKTGAAASQSGKDISNSVKPLALFPDTDKVEQWPLANCDFNSDDEVPLTDLLGQTENLKPSAQQLPAVDSEIKTNPADKKDEIQASGIENAASRYPLRVQISKEKIKQSLLNLKPQAKAKSKRVNQQLPTTNETKGAVDSESEKNPADKAAKIQGNAPTINATSNPTKAKGERVYQPVVAPSLQPYYEGTDWPSRVHPDLPPAEIYFQPIYWNASQKSIFDKKHGPTREFNFECVVLDEMVKLVFHLTALRYAEHFELNGQSTLDILRHPCLPKVTEEFYDVMMVLWERLETFTVPIKNPSTLPMSEESFCEYFRRVVQDEYTETVKDDEDASDNEIDNLPQVKDDHRDPLFKLRFKNHFWKLDDVGNQETFDKSLISNQIQKSKCFILLNIAVRHFFKTCFNSEEIRGHSFLKKMVQSSSAGKKISGHNLITNMFWSAANLESFFSTSWRDDITFDINMAAYHVPTIEYDWFSEVQDELIRDEFFSSNSTTRESDLVDRIKVFMYSSVQTLHGKIKPAPPPFDPITPVMSNLNKRALVRNVCVGPDGSEYLQRMIFNYNGSFRRDLRGAIDFGEKLGNIFLDLPEDTHRRNDFRLFFPFLMDRSKLHPDSLYNRIESLLQHLGLIDKEKEYLDDVGVISGGTYKQYIHIDYVGKKGDKTRKRDYESAMNGPNSPASILIGLGRLDGSNGPRLAIQAKDVDNVQLENDKRFCTIKNNRCKDVFRLIEHDQDEISVIQATEGFIFDGRFKHAGARTNHRGTKEELMCNRLEGMVREELGKPWADSRKFESIFNIMCNMEGLNAITRFHCHILPKGVDIVVKANSVGRDDCPNNPEL